MQSILLSLKIFPYPNICKDTNYLAFIYPAEDYDKLLNNIGSVDIDI